MNKKAKDRELEADWAKLLAKHAKPLEKGTGQKVVAAPALFKPKVVVVPPERDLYRLPSRSTGDNENATAVRETAVYTGTKIKGIGTMHKSNAVPVFSDGHAVDIARMRR